MPINYIVTDAIELCVNVLIPSVFPYMVAVNLLITCNFEKIVGKLLQRPFEALFHLNGNLATAFIIGIISGYPQGAHAVRCIYEKGGCSRREAEQALTFCNNSGPAFTIGAIAVLFGSKVIGITLFAMQIVISITYAVITRPKEKPQHTDNPENLTVNFGIIPKAVTDSVMPMLNICAFVISFAVICGMVSHIALPAAFKGFLYALLELTNATKFIADNHISTALLGFAVSWSGLSIHLQTYSVISGAFSMKRYFIAKTIQSVLIFLILYLKNLVI